MTFRGIPKQSPSDVMQIMKSITAREFFRIYPEIKKKYFWCGKLWTQSYFVETIGNATLILNLSSVTKDVFKSFNFSSRGCSLSSFLHCFNCLRFKALSSLDNLDWRPFDN